VNEHPTTDSEFEQRTRAAFDTSVAGLDGRTRSRLNQARQKAVAAAGHPSRQRWMRTLVPASGLVAAAVCAFVLQVGPLHRSPQSSQTVALEDLDIVSDADNLDLMQDIDFYAWMAANDAATP
jgi:hypothetical protein